MLLNLNGIKSSCLWCNTPVELGIEATGVAWKISGQGRAGEGGSVGAPDLDFAGSAWYPGSFGGTHITEFQGQSPGDGKAPLWFPASEKGVCFGSPLEHLLWIWAPHLSEVQACDSLPLMLPFLYLDSGDNDAGHVYEESWDSQFGMFLSLNET